MPAAAPGLELPLVGDCASDAGGANERRRPLPDRVASCAPAAGAATSGAGDGEVLLTDGRVPGVRVDLAGAVLRDPRLDAAEPEVALDAEPDEPELPEELPLTCASATIAPASSSEKVIE